MRFNNSIVEWPAQQIEMAREILDELNRGSFYEATENENPDFSQKAQNVFQLKLNRNNSEGIEAGLKLEILFEFRGASPLKKEFDLPFPVLDSKILNDILCAWTFFPKHHLNIEIHPSGVLSVRALPKAFNIVLESYSEVHVEAAIKTNDLVIRAQSIYLKKTIFTYKSQSYHADNDFKLKSAFSLNDVKVNLQESDLLIEENSHFIAFGELFVEAKNGSVNVMGSVRAGQGNYDLAFNPQSIENQANEHFKNEFPELLKDPACFEWAPVSEIVRANQVLVKNGLNHPFPPGDAKENENFLLDIMLKGHDELATFFIRMLLEEDSPVHFLEASHDLLRVALVRGNIKSAIQLFIIGANPHLSYESEGGLQADIRNFLKSISVNREALDLYESWNLLLSALVGIRRIEKQGSQFPSIEFQNLAARLSLAYQKNRKFVLSFLKASIEELVYSQHENISSNLHLGQFVSKRGFFVLVESIYSALKCEHISGYSEASENLANFHIAISHLMALDINIPCYLNLENSEEDEELYLFSSHNERRNFFREYIEKSEIFKTLERVNKDSSRKLQRSSSLPNFFTFPDRSTVGEDSNLGKSLKRN